MFKKTLLHGLTTSVLAALAAYIYDRIYFFATEADFSRIVNIGSILGTSLMVCILATFLNFGLVKCFRKIGELIFNFLFTICSFVSIMVPISISLPLDIKTPELFPGLAVPMIFFPALAWFTLRPLFHSEV